MSGLVRAGALLAIFLASMQNQPARYLALGDSYTIGEGVADADRWPMQLARRLRESSISVADPEIVARTGWTTDELDSAISDRAIRGPYALVTLLIGVNNQYRNRGVGEFVTELRALIARAVGFAGGEPRRVILVSIPDWGVTRFNTSRNRDFVAREIDAYNAAARDEAKRATVHWVDITDLTRAAPGEVVADGLHPNAAMYRQWTTRLSEVASAILRQR